MAFESLAEIVQQCEKEKKPFWQVVMEDDLRESGGSEEDSRERMRSTWDAMLLAAATYDEKTRSASKMAGGDGGKMERYLLEQEDGGLCGAYMDEVIAEALKMGESNACMKRIVAAPTAGACGVLPAALVPWFKHKKGNTEEILNAMYTAAGIGQVIALRASISGARGGCQAEIGAASAMTAGAMVCLKGGTAEQIIHAAAMALKNLLGLVCDPVAGLVEVPCIKRGVIGAVGAMAAADMALAGITSRIPPDQVVDAMREIGDKMDVSLRETALGGLAATPAGEEAKARFNLMQNE